MWNAFTGKNYTNEAESILDEARIYFEKTEAEYKAVVETMSAEIERKISDINACKQKIYNTHFKRFISIASRLHNVTVKGVPFEELFDKSVLEVKNLQSVRERNEIIKIDFDNMSVWQTTGMILTLGFGTRKKAKEALEDAKQERIRVDEEVEKMNAQKTKLKVIIESIDLVMEYFDTLISSYASLLDRFEYGIQTQRVKQMANSNNVLTLRLNFKQIPIVHIEEFQALFNLSIVLKQMATLGYLSESGEVISQDMDKSNVIIQTAKAAALCA
ncbi:DNA repair protein [Marinomonas sp. IMCC 4694]|nr:DNA repair protein [Marinomonas sp. IMCC 4694]